MAIDPQNLSGTASITFADEFNSLNLRTDGSGTWNTNYHWGASNGVTLSGNGEQEWYIDANYAPTQSVIPWTVDNGILDITAQNASPEIQSLINGYQYTSGMLTTHDSFSQKYGYFEIRAELPQGDGLWPAFWLLPQDGSWPPEIDVMEHLGHDPNMYYTFEHSNATGTHTSNGAGIATPDLTASFHTYGVNWEADNLTYYFDGKQVFQTETPDDMHKPMYMLVNLAVGGYWPGDPTPDPNFSETLHVDYVRAYSSKPDGEITAAAPAIIDASPPAVELALTDSPTPSPAPVSADAAANSVAPPALEISESSSVPVPPSQEQAAATPTQTADASPDSHMADAATPTDAASSTQSLEPALPQEQAAATPTDAAGDASPDSHLADAATATDAASSVQSNEPAPLQEQAVATPTQTADASPDGYLADAAPAAEAASSGQSLAPASSAESFDFAALTSTQTANDSLTTSFAADLQSAVDEASPVRGNSHWHGHQDHASQDFSFDFQSITTNNGHGHGHGHGHGNCHHHWGF